MTSRRQQYSFFRGFVVSMSSLLLGASVVHNILEPNLEIPDLTEEMITEEDR
jgi:hypothetical protein